MRISSCLFDRCPSLAPRIFSRLSPKLTTLALGLVLMSCARPQAEFMADLQDTTAPASVTFTNKSQGADSYLWDFGDGNTSTDPNPSHRYTTSGNYLVTLRAIDKRRSDLDSHRLQIIGPLQCMVEITTPYGKMLVQLSDKTPLHRDNFIKLVEEGFYQDLLFHRIIDGFMIQGGDPQSRAAGTDVSLGSGGPGYTIAAEFAPELAHVKGALAAARLGDAMNPQKNSSGSQFYIVAGRPVTDTDLKSNEARKGINYNPSTRAAYLENGGVPFLDAEYTVFGHVVEGLEVIDKIAQAKKDSRDRPTENIPMKMRIIN